jgi:hypothetical protein
MAGHFAYLVSILDTFTLQTTSFIAKALLKEFIIILTIHNLTAKINK